MNDRNRIIAHLDMDAFFASVEERDNPRLAGWPIAVGSDPAEGRGRGVVSTANYAARAYGIRSALPISKAWQLSQQAKKQGKREVVFLSVNMAKYCKVSEKIISIMQKYSSEIEQASIDEAYIDLSFAGSFQEAEKICEKIKKEILGSENLTASMGLAKNKLIAKIASDMQKPDGLTVVEEKETQNFLDPLSIRKIPGVGPKSEIFWKGKGIFSIRDLKKYSLEEMVSAAGKSGGDLYRKIRGMDDSIVAQEYGIKSIGEQETFREDSLDFKFVFERLEIICGNVLRKLQENNLKSFRTMVVTVRFSDFETKTRSHTIVRKTDSIRVLKGEIAKLLLPFFDSRDNPRRKKIRLIGARIEKLE
jgi:DNA polymerase IV (DinB-like DNA polymerase)